MQLITIKESHFVSDLMVLKSRLESERIECFLENELTAQVLHHIPSMIVRLRIFEFDFERAQVFLTEFGGLSAEIKEIVCPKCGSGDYYGKRSLKEKWRFFISILSTLVTFKSTNNSYQPESLVCTNCKHEFFNK